MAIIQYYCEKHPQYTKRGTVPVGMVDEKYSKDNGNKGKIKYESIMPICPKCRKKMVPLSNKKKGNKYSEGVYSYLDENFNKKLKWNIKRKKVKKGIKK